MVQSQIVLYAEGYSPQNKPKPLIVYRQPEPATTQRAQFAGDRSIGRPSTKSLSAQMLKDAAAIMQLDLNRNGVISRAICPFHGKTCLAYLWHGPKEGARVSCKVDGCKWTTHFEVDLWVPGVDGNESETGHVEIAENYQ